jgi:pimeloyl-ACP methyl ester carboxylesterase
VKVGGDTVYYQVAGEGEPIILVHGLSASSLWWIRNVPALAEHYRVYLLDLPGFGTMRRYASRFTLDRLSNDIIAWMEVVGIKQAHFIGHSMGGYVCLRIAAHKPRIVKRLILIAPAAIPAYSSVLGYTRPILAAMRVLSPAFFPILIYDTLRAGPLMLLRATRDLVSRDIRTSLQEITVPTLLIWGENDTLVPLALSDLLRAEIPDARLLIIKKAGHVVMFDQSQQCNAAILAFLDGANVGN